MTQQAVTFAGMHAEHRQWASEHAMWTDDIESWRQQYATALAQLAQLEQLIRQHGETLDVHAQSIERIRHSSQGHETAMALYLREGADAEGQEAMFATHRKKAQHHVQQREAHEQIKKGHHTMMAHLGMLKSALDPSS